VRSFEHHISPHLTRLSPGVLNSRDVCDAREFPRSHVAVEQYMSKDAVEQLAHSWMANAAAWTRAVRTQQIASRRLATDAAIVHAILERAPRRVLDIGCGEGWLCRALAGHGIEAVGIDASTPLVEAARALGGTFYTLSYTALAAHPEWRGCFEVVVCNFALLEEHLAPVLRTLQGLLTPGGILLIQTVHPWSAGGEAPYRDGWRMETFHGFGHPDSGRPLSLLLIAVPKSAEHL
jgi:2-polyprenyl-3-methyl-5-hydroxy-6-metoxy-1,4-benzoquinol methylase